MEQKRLNGLNTELFDDVVSVFDDKGMPEADEVYTSIEPSAETASVPAGTVYVSKRIMDIAISGVGVIATLPVTVGTAAAIAIEGLFDKSARGPIFYSQERAGLNGKSFRIYKFRSMVDNAHEKHSEVFSDGTSYDATAMLGKNVKDPRITKVGAFIRKTGLDELPQFLNILKGDMSIVGPRPYIPELVEATKAANGSEERYQCLPGVTGPMQLKRHLYDDEGAIMKLDSEYTDMYKSSYSVFKDMGYIAKTVGLVLSGKHH
jgi:lipopolysaccharide/colanic/teichoic acid biosynthesis glycosyltransferase